MMPTESSIVSRMKLSARSQTLRSVSGPVPSGGVTVPADILTAVHDALIGGETHYTNRPGIPALRGRVVEAIQLLGGPVFDSNLGVVITAGTREALFVTILGLRLSPGEVIVHEADDVEFADLFCLMGLRPISIGDIPTSSADARLVYLEREHADDVRVALIAAATVKNLPVVLNVRSSIGAGQADALSGVDEKTTIIGDLDALTGIAAFRVGFVAGPVAMIAGARVWKQAFSICTAAPSQRAALVALDAWRKEAR